MLSYLTENKYCFSVTLSFLFKYIVDHIILFISGIFGLYSFLNMKLFFVWIIIIHRSYFDNPLLICDLWLYPVYYNISRDPGKRWNIIYQYKFKTIIIFKELRKLTHNLVCLIQYSDNTTLFTSLQISIHKCTMNTKN